MKEPIFDMYVDRVISLFGITREELFSKNKKADLSDARKLLYYLCYHRPMRIRYIEQYMADNGYVIGHSTIIYGIKQIQNRVDTDPDYRKLISKIS